MSQDEKKKPISRISIQEDGTLIVTDLWNEVDDLLDTKDGDFERLD